MLADSAALLADRMVTVVHPIRYDNVQLQVLFPDVIKQRDLLRHYQLLLPVEIGAKILPKTAFEIYVNEYNAYFFY